MTDFEFLTCGECGIEFAAPKTFIQTRRDGDQSARKFYCPNGHCRVFRETEIDRVRRERDSLKQQNARLEIETQEAWRAEAAAKAATAAEKRARARIEKRLGAGVCPCCNRSFVALARHMQTKHPEVPFVPSANKRKTA